ncbi:hypothetical protein RchiOBHm_Chr4g0391051 [Rosa chinensis]|uniref:Uncharacterized protein n=1 Tax=Rosa chinensis TaxID=74649 RepID=A0A2P6QQF2_ROSCH|nr:hypothetical protein RchiOBHm_Chr4g0391051 [Rosa chinensis]
MGLGCSRARGWAARGRRGWVVALVQAERTREAGSEALLQGWDVRGRWKAAARAAGLG